MIYWYTVKDALNFTMCGRAVAGLMYSACTMHVMHASSCSQAVLQKVLTKDVNKKLPMHTQCSWAAQPKGGAVLQRVVLPGKAAL